MTEADLQRIPADDDGAHRVRNVHIFGAGAFVPIGLQMEEFVLRPIRSVDAERDFAAVMETRELLRLWEQSAWPADDFTVEANRDDLCGLEERHVARRAYTFTVVDPSDSECLGCVYVFVTNEQFTQQVALLAQTDLTLKFELVEPAKPGTYLVFG